MQVVRTKLFCKRKETTDQDESSAHVLVDVHTYYLNGSSKLQINGIRNLKKFLNKHKRHNKCSGK